jgi:hypothetical protein
MTRLILISLPFVVLLLGCEAVKPAILPKSPASIERTGHFVIKPQFSETYQFAEGLAAMRIGDTTTGKWGFISR